MVIAHAGGWDELSVFVVVGLVAVLVIRRAERKARERAEREPSASQGEE